MYKSYKSAVKSAHKSKNDMKARIFPYKPATKERKRKKGRRQKEKQWINQLNKHKQKTNKQ